VKRWVVVDEACTPEGTRVTLEQCDGDYAILAGPHILMSSRMHGSEELLAAHGCAHARTLPRPRVLIGGLGLGFTLRAALDLLPPSASVTVSELLPKVVDWNRGPLGPLAAHPLADPRVRVEIGDVARLLASSRDAFDAVLLDVDNGPAALTADANARLYSDRGISHARGALAAGGVLAVWSAGQEREFERRLRRAGFGVRVERVRARVTKGARHTIVVASARPADRPAA
jgi:spermidine synthase